MYPISRPLDSAQSIDLTGGDDAAAPSVCPASLLTIAEELHPRALQSDSSPNQTSTGLGLFGKHSNRCVSRRQFRLCRCDLAACSARYYGIQHCSTRADAITYGDPTCDQH